MVEKSAIRSIHNSGVEVTEIIDVTPMPHNGCRPRKEEYNLNYNTGRFKIIEGYRPEFIILPFSIF